VGVCIFITKETHSFWDFRVKEKFFSDKKGKIHNVKKGIRNIGIETKM
jgi:hypothetical protein